VVHGARGFCNINIEAIMIEFLRQAYGVNRVAIVDTDCHHGDGTQDIYWHDPDTLFISMHQDGRTLYPGSGFPHEQGGPNALGTTVNIPLPPYTAEEGFLYTIENIVLPILDDFKPDLIINSAGQDNHYTDPITNMNFSARGYADLTSMLKPHIAVLEGGYSIEGALPYVNVGIILALAGVDYSHVKEPDYDTRTLRRQSDILEQIKEVEVKIKENWQSKEMIRRAIQQSKDFVQRNRTIFYDTEGITETQTEKIRVCKDCGGALRIDSRSDRGNHILAVHVPRKACPACIETGHQWFDEKETENFDMVFLQDRTTDKYMQKKKS